MKWKSKWGEQEFIEALVYEEPRYMWFSSGSALRKLDSLINIVPIKQALGKTQNMYLHVLLRYEDILERNYWVYSRWDVKVEIIGFHQNKVEYVITRSPEDYVIWIAEPNNLIPDTSGLPFKLK